MPTRAELLRYRDRSGQVGSSDPTAPPAGGDGDSGAPPALASSGETRRPSSIRTLSGGGGVGEAGPAGGSIRGGGPAGGGGVGGEGGMDTENR